MKYRRELGEDFLRLVACSNVLPNVQCQSVGWMRPDTRGGQLRRKSEKRLQLATAEKKPCVIMTSVCVVTFKGKLLVSLAVQYLLGEWADWQSPENADHSTAKKQNLRAVVFKSFEQTSGGESAEWPKIYYPGRLKRLLRTHMRPALPTGVSTGGRIWKKHNMMDQPSQVKSINQSINRLAIKQSINQSTSNRLASNQSINQSTNNLCWFL